MPFHVPNKYRVREHPLLSSSDAEGNNGFFEIPLPNGVLARVIASDGRGWEHLTVHVVEDKEEQTPTWDEMCTIKRIFWGKDVAVVQLHLPERTYINNHPNVLHLWKKKFSNWELPPPNMVGVKKGKRPHNRKQK